MAGEDEALSFFGSSCSKSKFVVVMVALREAKSATNGFVLRGEDRFDDAAAASLLRVLPH